MKEWNQSSTECIKQLSNGLFFQSVKAISFSICEKHEGCLQGLMSFSYTVPVKGLDTPSNSVFFSVFVLIKSHSVS